MENIEEQDLTALISDKIVNVSDRINEAEDKDVGTLVKAMDTLVQDYVSVEKFKFDVQKHYDEHEIKVREQSLEQRKAKDQRISKYVDWGITGLAALVEIGATTWAFKTILNANIELGNNGFRDAGDVLKRLTSIKLPVIKVK